MKKTILALFLCSLSSCNTGAKRVNYSLNKEYQASVKTFNGNLNSTDLNVVRARLEIELNTKLHPDKAIVINYVQSARNCFEMQFPKQTRAQIMNNSVRISSKLSLEGNAQDFFVYNNDGFDVDLLSKQDKFILDSGFFHKEIFTLHENCRAFFIIKPNGDFIKHYGSDYYTHVKNFLQSN